MERKIKSVSDYDAFEALTEATRWEVEPDRLAQEERVVGDSGIVAVSIEATPVQALLQHELGVDKFAYHLHDHTSRLERLMELMHEKNCEAYELAAQSPAEHIMLYENTSTTMISPAIYEKYSLRHVTDFVDTVHRHGKVAIVHMCGHVNRLLHLIAQTGLDAVDCLTPCPTGDVDFEHAIDIFGPNVVIHGVLDPSHWALRPIDEIEGHIRRLLTPKVMSHPFVLCTAADGQRGYPMQKFAAIGELMAQYAF